MDQAAAFADAVASLVNAYQSAKLFRDLGGRMLSSEDQSAAAIREWLSEVRETAEHREMIDLALLIRDVAQRGESQRLLAREILESVIRFSEAGQSDTFLA
jgi:hypothetical protein